MRAENLIWIGEPTNKYDEKYKRWPQYTLWPFKAEFNGKKCDTIFYMNETEHEVYLAKKKLLDGLTHWGIYEGGPARPELIKLIEEYGDKREEKGREDVHEGWAELKAGSGL